jgi:hypothetical protein
MVVLKRHCGMVGSWNSNHNKTDLEHDEDVVAEFGKMPIDSGDDVFTFDVRYL